MSHHNHHIRGIGGVHHGHGHPAPAPHGGGQQPAGGAQKSSSGGQSQGGSGSNPMSAISGFMKQAQSMLGKGGQTQQAKAAQPGTQTGTQPPATQTPTPPVQPAAVAQGATTGALDVPSIPS